MLRSRLKTGLGGLDISGCGQSWEPSVIRRKIHHHHPRTRYGDLSLMISGNLISPHLSCSTAGLAEIKIILGRISEMEEVKLVPHNTVITSHYYYSPEIQHSSFVQAALYWDPRREAEGGGGRCISSDCILIFLIDSWPTSYYSTHLPPHRTSPNTKQISSEIPGKYAGTVAQIYMQHFSFYLQFRTTLKFSVEKPLQATLTTKTKLWIKTCVMRGHCFFYFYKSLYGIARSTTKVYWNEY